jgi:hypothetical protein
MTASASGTSSTLPLIVSVEPAIAMSTTANATWIATAIASRTGAQLDEEASIPQG